MKNLAQKITDQLKEVDQAIIDSVASYPSEVNTFVKSIVNAGGKRLRSKICLAFAHAHQLDPNSSKHIAASIEMLHLATLIHDDLIDNGDLRRGITPLHKSIGSKSTILFGDVLFAISAQLLSQNGTNQMVTAFAQTVETIARSELENSLSDKMIFDEQQAYQLAYTKTGVLFELASKIMLLDQSSTEEEIAFAIEFGKEFGIAYQLIDDLVDLGIGSKESKKSINKDLSNNTLTLPFIFYYKNLTIEEQSIFQQEIRSQDPAQLISLIRSSTAISKTKQEIDCRIKKAKNALDFLPLESKNYLLEVIDQTRAIID